MDQRITDAAGRILCLYAEPLNLVSYNSKSFSGSTGPGGFYRGV